MDAIELTQELKGGERIEWCAAPDTLSAVIATVHNRSPGDPKLWLVGKITYIDGLDCERETGFCRVYDPIDEIWKRVDNSDYDYDY